MHDSLAASLHRATPRPRRARLSVLALFLANGAGVGAWAALIPALRQALALSDGALSLALLAFAAGAILAMPVAGWLGARAGAARVALAAAAAFALALLLPGLAATLPALVAAALLLGACAGAMDVAMNAQATLVERDWRAPIMSSFHAAFSLGGLVGAACSGALLAAGVATGTVFAVAGAGAGLLLLAAASLGPSRGVAAGRSGGIAVPLALPDRRMLGIGALAFLALLVEGAVGDWSGVFLATVVGAPMAAAPAGFAAFSVAMVAGRLLGDRTVQALGSARALRLGALFAAAGFLLALTGATLPSAAAGFALVGLGLANIVPVLITAAGSNPAVPPSLGVAMVATLGYAGLLLGPPLIGFAAEAAGLRPALLLLPATALAVAAGARAVGRR